MLCFVLSRISGADFYALAADAFALALHDVVERIEALGESEVKAYQMGLKSTTVEVGEEHFEKALKNLTPSVSAAELERYDNLQKNYRSQKGH